MLRRLRRPSPDRTPQRAHLPHFPPTPTRHPIATQRSVQTRMRWLPSSAGPRPMQTRQQCQATTQWRTQTLMQSRYQFCSLEGMPSWVQFATRAQSLSQQGCELQLTTRPQVPTSLHYDRC